MATINSKREFYRLWQLCALGNRLRVWQEPAAAHRSDVLIVGFREIGKAGGGSFEVCQREHVLSVARSWDAQRLQYMICEAAPDILGRLQGEICRDLYGWHGLLGLVKDGRRMRDSMSAGDLKACHGIQVLDLLDRYMDANSRDDLEQLLELYPDATVEFTTYACDLGILPNRNTIFWEVRDY